MIRPSTPADIAAIHGCLRTEDIAEIKAISGNDPMFSLMYGHLHSAECVVGVGGDKIVMIAGVQGIPKTEDAYVWMLCTPHIMSHKRELLTLGREWLDKQNKRYRVLRNVVDARNTVHIRLVTHMGFTFGDPIENYGAGRITVIPFERVLNV